MMRILTLTFLSCLIVAYLINSVVCSPVIKGGNADTGGETRGPAEERQAPDSGTGCCSCLTKTIGDIPDILGMVLCFRECCNNNPRPACCAQGNCYEGEEIDTGLCYPKCDEGYYGVGPVCWQSCPQDYHDDGALCRRDVVIKGKGCCCTVFGCCDNCEEGYHDDGCTCRKDAHIFAKSTYGRGVGKPIPQ